LALVYSAFLFVRINATVNLSVSASYQASMCAKRASSVLIISGIISAIGLD